MENYPKPAVLKNDDSIVLRLLKEEDIEDLITFFSSIPLEDRMYLRAERCLAPNRKHHPHYRRLRHLQ